MVEPVPSKELVAYLDRMFAGDTVSFEITKAEWLAVKAELIAQRHGLTAEQVAAAKERLLQQVEDRIRTESLCPNCGRPARVLRTDQTGTRCWHCVEASALGATPSAVPQYKDEHGKARCDVCDMVLPEHKFDCDYGEANVLQHPTLEPPAVTLRERSLLSLIDRFYELLEDDAENSPGHDLYDLMTLAQMAIRGNPIESPAPPPGREHDPAICEANERLATIMTGAAGKHAERVIELEAEVSTLRESLAEVNRLLSLHVAEVERLKACKDQGPGEEDGPWAEGWEQRAGLTKSEKHCACGEKLVGHEDESPTKCRWCVTGWKPTPDDGRQSACSAPGERDE